MKKAVFTLFSCFLLASCALFTKNRHTERAETKHLSQISQTNESVKTDSTALNSLKIENKGIMYKVDFYSDTLRPAKVFISANDSVYIEGPIKAIESAKTSAKVERIDSITQKHEQAKQEAQNKQQDTTKKKEVNKIIPFASIGLLAFFILLFMFAIHFRKQLAGLLLKIKNKFSLWKL